MRGVRLIVTAGLAISAWAGVVAAHEFWISPQAYEVPATAPVQADLRVGQTFKGPTYSYVPANFKRFELVQGGVVTKVTGRAGDQPALNQTAPAEGLLTVVHVTKDYTLRYAEWQKFVDFAAHKDFTTALERHKARGLPDTGFGERYSRHAKSLIAVGSHEGADQEVGLIAEIVAETNPYEPGADSVTVRALYQGKPLADTQIELFEKTADGVATSAYYRTDAAGRATLPIKPAHEYLVDAVVLRELDPTEDTGPVWETLWASLTFRVPG